MYESEFEKAFVNMLREFTVMLDSCSFLNAGNPMVQVALRFFNATLKGPARG